MTVDAGRYQGSFVGTEIDEMFLWDQAKSRSERKQQPISKGPPHMQATGRQRDATRTKK